MSQATSTVPERRILEDALSCNLHKIGTSLIEKVVDVCPHPEPISQARGTQENRTTGACMQQGTTLPTVCVRVCVCGTARRRAKL